MKIFFSLFLLLCSYSLEGQQVISGAVSDERGRPLTGANVFLQGTYEGATTDTAGRFTISCRLYGQYYLVVRYLGYRQYHEELTLGGTEPIVRNIGMQPDQTDIREVYITAGSFEAGDRKKGIVLNSMDISMNAGALGDIAGAMNTLPGTMRVGDEGALFVRGGDKHETRTLIDGMMVEKPYTAKNTDFPVRSRFSPLLFKGTLFSTGGYSAEYGQALSSVLLLTTNSTESDDLASVTVHNVGTGVNLVRNRERTTITSSTSYSNLWLYYKLFPPDISWDNMPSSVDQTFTLRRRTGEDGMLKLMGTYSYSHSSLFYPYADDSLREDHIELANHNAFIKATYNDQLGDNWLLKAGWALNLDNERTGINDDRLQRKLYGMQTRLAFYGDVLPNTRIKIGAGYLFHNFSQEYREAASGSAYAWEAGPTVFSAFAESETSVLGKLALRLGARAEHAGLTGESVLSPRISLAMNTGKYSQASFAFGQFNQLPDDEYLIYAPGLSMERAGHIMLNYQVEKTGRMFRAEGYLKDYSMLVCFDSVYSYLPEQYGNQGTGYAGGIDLFYRDRTTFRNGDLWVSYSWIDSKRLYHEYTQWHVPRYITRHNLSVVYRQFFESVQGFAGFSYSFASGRPYYDPNRLGDPWQYTSVYNDLSINLLKITRVFGKFAAVHCVVNNVLGFDNVFGYRFARQTDENGYYPSMPVKPPQKRFFVVGLVLLLDDPM